MSGRARRGVCGQPPLEQAEKERPSIFALQGDRVAPVVAAEERGQGRLLPLAPDKTMDERERQEDENLAAGEREQAPGQ
jgi:hypothetical protein